MTRRNASLFALVAALALLGSIPAAAQEREPREPARSAAADRGWLGISLDWEDGPVTVQAVVPGSPAARAGVARGDTVVRIGGEAASAEVVRRLRPGPGETVRLRLRRDGRERDLDVVAERRGDDVIVFRRDGGDVTIIDPDSIRDRMTIRLDTVGARLDSLFVRMDSLRVGSEARRLFRSFPLDSLMDRARWETIPFGLELGSRALAGAEFTQMNAGLGRYFQTEKGLLTLRVAPGTPAARAGLESGDVVVKVDGKDVETLRDLRQTVARAKEPTAKLEVIRQGRRRELTLRWERGDDDVRMFTAPRGFTVPREPRRPPPVTD